MVCGECIRMKFLIFLLVFLIGSASAFTGYWSTGSNITLTASSPEIIRGGAVAWPQVITLSDPSLNTTAREVINRYAHTLSLKAPSGKKILYTGVAYSYLNTSNQFAWCRIVPFNSTMHEAVGFVGTWTGA